MIGLPGPAPPWRPDARFFGQIKKDQALAVARAVIGPEFAARHAKTKRSDLAVIMGQLFDPGSEEHAKLDEAQKSRVVTWLSDCMAFGHPEGPSSPRKVECRRGLGLPQPPLAE